MNGGRINTQQIADARRTQRQLTHNPKIHRSMLTRTRRGNLWGPLKASSIPASPCSRYLKAKRNAVVTETWKRLSARRNGHLS